jgi:hypothetical protein
MTFPVYWVNRNPFNRKRHADPKCRHLKQAREYLDVEIDGGRYEHWLEETGHKPPTQRTRFQRIACKSPEDLAALEAFTLPCRTCVPGADSLWRELPFDFEPRT